MTRTTNEQTRNREEVLMKIVNRSQTVINGLTESPAWGIVLEDITAHCKELDNTWQYVSDDKKMHEFRITKIAVMKILNLINDYKSDMQRASQELKSLVSPETTIEKDVDNEGAEHGIE